MEREGDETWLAKRVFNGREGHVSLRVLAARLAEATPPDPAPVPHERVLRFCIGLQNQPRGQERVTFGQAHQFLVRFGPRHLSLAKARASLFDADGQLVRWFHGALERPDAETKVRVGQPGAFLIRYSLTKPDYFSLTYKQDVSKILNCLLCNCGEGGFSLKDEYDCFPSIAAFVQANSSSLLAPVPSSLAEKCAEEVAVDEQARPYGVFHPQEFFSSSPHLRHSGSSSGGSGLGHARSHPPTQPQPQAAPKPPLPQIVVSPELDVPAPDAQHPPSLPLPLTSVHSSSATSVLSSSSASSSPLPMSPTSDLPPHMPHPHPTRPASHPRTPVHGQATFGNAYGVVVGWPDPATPPPQHQPPHQPQHQPQHQPPHQPTAHSHQHQPPHQHQHQPTMPRPQPLPLPLPLSAVSPTSSLGSGPSTPPGSGSGPLPLPLSNQHSFIPTTFTGAAATATPAPLFSGPVGTTTPPPPRFAGQGGPGAGGAVGGGGGGGAAMPASAQAASGGAADAMFVTQPVTNASAGGAGVAAADATFVTELGRRVDHGRSLAMGDQQQQDQAVQIFSSVLAQLTGKQSPNELVLYLRTLCAKAALLRDLRRGNEARALLDGCVNVLWQIQTFEEARMRHADWLAAMTTAREVHRCLAALDWESGYFSEAVEHWSEVIGYCTDEDQRKWTMDNFSGIISECEPAQPPPSPGGGGGGIVRESCGVPIGKSSSGELMLGDDVLTLASAAQCLERAVVAIKDQRLSVAEAELKRALRVVRLSDGGAVGQVVEVRALGNLGFVSAKQQDSAAAMVWYRQCLRLMVGKPQHDDMRKKVLNALTLLCKNAARYSDALRFCEQHLSIASDRENVRILEQRLAEIHRQAAAAGVPLTSRH